MKDSKHFFDRLKSAAYTMVVIWFYIILSFVAIWIFKLFLSWQRKERAFSVLYLENFPVENSGYYYRAAKWRDLLNAKNIPCDVWTLIESKLEFDRLKTRDPSRLMRRTVIIRFGQVLKSRRYSHVIVRRELLFFNDYGGRFMEKLLLSIHPNAILDFDDDISVAKREPRKNIPLFGKLLLEDGNKFANTLRMYSKFIVVSDYLKKLVTGINHRVGEGSILVLPTCVDYCDFRGKMYDASRSNFTFGWIGGDHNYPLLNMLIPILNELSQAHNFRLKVIGGREYAPVTKFDLIFVPWALNTEKRELLEVDVGLMPLKNDRRSQGKGGFKLIQYMGLGIVGVAQAITVNNEIVKDGVDSFLVDSPEGWRDRLIWILRNKDKLAAIGINARKKVSEKYSFEAHLKALIQFLQNEK